MASMSKNKRVYGHHDPELIKDEVHEIKTKKMSIKQAAKHVRLLLSTLCNKKRDKRPVVYTNRTLNQAEKNRLAQWRINLRKHGFGNSYKEIVEIVPDILAAKNLSHSPETIIKKPSRQWLSGFYRQHPEFSIRSSKACGKETVVSSTPKKFEKWFSNFIKCMNQSDPTILSSSNRIFIPDERGFSFDPKSREVVANKCSTHVTSYTMTLATVLACLIDAAQYTAPLLIYPCKRNPRQNLLEDFPEALLQVSSDVNTTLPDEENLTSQDQLETTAPLSIFTPPYAPETSLSSIPHDFFKCPKLPETSTSAVISQASMSSAAFSLDTVASYSVSITTIQPDVSTSYSVATSSAPSTFQVLPEIPSSTLPQSPPETPSSTSINLNRQQLNALKENSLFFLRQNIQR
ncbi:jerky protein [Biomphalaria pfeifferi]|uniref:Jerky protein n=1 Tax=Biomphalaria pfeifferi TaxID=112525 RepID=A0AAD8F0R1_BIOPF|nr:jerky protein [Biomphalaria pfeifferi]